MIKQQLTIQWKRDNREQQLLIEEKHVLLRNLMIIKLSVTRSDN